MEAGMQGSSQPAQPHQDDRLREQLVAERQDAAQRREQLAAEAEAQHDYSAREIDRCDRVVHACNLALERLDPPKLAMAPPDSATLSQQMAAQHGLAGVPR